MQAYSSCDAGGTFLRCRPTSHAVPEEHSCGTGRASGANMRWVPIRFSNKCLKNEEVGKEATSQGVYVAEQAARELQMKVGRRPIYESWF